jgi:hypothetical protein
MRRPPRAAPALAALAVAGLLGGCTAWPARGTGGAAEIRANPPADAAAAAALSGRLDCSLGRFEALRQQAAAAGLLAGRVALVEETALRARREHHGGLMQDSARTLDRLDAEVTAVASELPMGARMVPGGCA